MPYFSISRLFLYLAPVTIAIVTKSTLFPFIVGKYVWFRGIMDISLIFFILGLLFEKNKEEDKKRIAEAWKKPLTLAVASFVFFFTLSAAFARNRVVAFWSNFERGEGALQIIHLGIFFFLLIALFTKEEHWRKFFWVGLWSAILMLLYGLGAGAGYNGFIGPTFEDPAFRFQGSIGNPAYVAAYLIFSAFYGFYLLFTLYRRHLWRSPGALVIWCMLAVFGAAFLLAATRGAFLGLGAGAFIMLAYVALSNRSWRKWAIGVGAALAITGVLLVTFRENEFVRRIPGSRIFDISFTAETFEHRTIMWGIAWESFKERPVLGWGPENFGYLFQKNFNPAYFKPEEGFGAWFDRAHNVFFDYLVAGGVIGLVSYVSMFAAFYWGLWKKRKFLNLPSGVMGAIFALPAAYLVQGLVLFDVLVIYINIFIMLAFGWYVAYGKEHHEKRV